MEAQATGLFIIMKKLTNIRDIQVGDYLPVSHPDSSIPILAEINNISTNPNSCSYQYLDKTYFSRILEKDLKQVVLLRKTRKGIDILAGEEAYKLLTNERLHKALAKICLKKRDPCDGIE